MSSPLVSQSALLTSVFGQLTGTWLLNRQLRSADPSEPSGRCTGTATFAKVQSPSPVLDGNGRLHIADAELLYHEQGEFEMMRVTGNNLTTVPTFTFSRKYIWRLQKAKGAHTIGIWFTKPGTEAIDYLFHEIDVPFHEAQTPEARSRLVLTGTGGHLCVDDFYSSSYTFTMSQEDNNSSPNLLSWTTIHEVLGPKKDQHIETTFVRP